MPRDLTHAVLEGLDEAKSTGGLVIMKKKKKEGEEEEKGGFKLPVGPSKLGLDRYESFQHPWIYLESLKSGKIFGGIACST